MGQSLRLHLFIFLSVVYPFSTQSEDIVADARAFLQSQAWYEKKGIPYRRGYLIYGPPGTGITVFLLITQPNIYFPSPYRSLFR